MASETEFPSMAASSAPGSSVSMPLLRRNLRLADSNMAVAATVETAAAARGSLSTFDKHSWSSPFIALTRSVRADEWEATDYPTYFPTFSPTYASTSTRSGSNAITDTPSQSQDCEDYEYAIRGAAVTNASDTDTYIITFVDRDTSSEDRCYALAEALGGTVEGIFEEVNACSLILPRTTGEERQSQRGDAQAALDDPSVKLIEVNQEVVAFKTKVCDKQLATSSSSSYAAVPWGLDRINQCSLPLDNTTTPQDAAHVAVFVIDSGIRGTHAEFEGMIDPTGTTGCHFSAFDTDPLIDGYGHGTHVAGTICGRTYGVANLINSKLCAVKVLNDAGSGSTAGFLAGIDYVMNYCRTQTSMRCVINISVDGSSSVIVNNAVRDAVDANIIVVMAAGNDNADACGTSPASELSAITVGSTTKEDTRSSFSNTGPCVDIYAPGSDILSAWKDSDMATNTLSGTSMACPLVTGIALGLLASDNTLSPDQVRNRIVNRAFTISDRFSSSIKLATVNDCGTPIPTYNPTS